MINVCECFGYHSKNTVLDVNGDDAKIKAVVMTACNVAGYFPIIGIASAIFRVLVVWGDEDLPMTFKVTMICRGVVEFFGLGVLFLIPDLIVTIARFYCDAGIPDRSNMSIIV